MNWREKYLLHMRKLPVFLTSLPGKNYSKLLTALIVLAALGIIIGAGVIFAQSQVTITGLEINQALGVQKDNHKYFVAGKNTVMRAFLSPAVTIDQANTWVNVSRGGQQAFKIYPKKTTGNVSTVDFLCANMTTSCGNWAAGSYTFQPYINGTEGSVSSSYEFSTGAKIRVLAVAVKANYGNGRIKTLTGEQLKALETMGDFMQTVYPLAKGNLVWKVREKELDASADKYNLYESAGDGDEQLSKELAKLIPVKCKTSPQDE
jgi:hypothetical protein